jgi:hypothetical protein
VFAAAETRGVITADPDPEGPLPGVEFHEKPGASGARKKATRGAARERGQRQQDPRAGPLLRRGLPWDKWTAAYRVDAGGPSVVHLSGADCGP